MATANGRAICGEATPNYLAHPDAAARLHSVAPNARLIVGKRWNLEPHDFLGAPEAEPERLPEGFEMARSREIRERFTTASCATRGQCADQLEPWLDAYFAEPNRRSAEPTDDAITWP
jgi:hypothetical protein